MPSWTGASDQMVGILAGVLPASPWTRALGAAVAISGRGLDMFARRRNRMEASPGLGDLLDREEALLHQYLGDAPAPAKATTPPTGQTSRYLAEEGKPVDTDCFNCASAHLAALAGALHQAATAAEQHGTCDDTCQSWLRLAVQEPGILLEHDWPPDKQWPADQQAVVEQYRPQVEALLRGSLGNDDTTDQRLLIQLAAAGLKEGTRFTKSGDPIDHPEVEVRRLRAEQQLASAERLDVTAFEGPVADNLRHLRQQVSGNITDSQSLVVAAAVADRIAQTANAPAFAQQDPATLRALAHRANTLHEEFAAARRHHGAPAQVFTRTGKAYEDVDTRIPDVLAQSMLGDDPEAPPAPAGGSLLPLLGATPQTEAAMHHLLRLDAARRVPVRIEELPTVIDNGRYAGQILGAYYPGEHAILLGPQVFAEDPEDVNTVLEETAHSLLHNRQCDIYPPMDVPYLDIPEEREAKAATLLAILSTGLPSETDTGRPIPAGTVRKETDAALANMDPLMRSRTTWAADILTRAIQGDIAGAAAQAAACPKTLPAPGVA